MFAGVAGGLTPAVCYVGKMTFDPRKIAEIFLPHAVRETARIRTSGQRFAHYTSADTALKILRSERMLLRNSSLMNDFSEVRHGLDCLRAAYTGPGGQRLKEALKQVQDDLPEVLEENFNAEVVDVLAETYLMSLSEHDTGHEDAFGRLSMWRAYAPKDGVAFILNNGPFLSESNALNAYSSPVVYATADEYRVPFEEFVASIEANIETLRPFGGQFVHDMVVTAFRFAVQSTKHPSFKEEREWRVLYTPTILLRNGAMTDTQLQRIPTEIMSLGGVPQRVYAVPFRDHPDEGFTGATIPALLDRVLVGPSRDAYAIAQAFVAELSRFGVPDAPARVVITNVPLRN